MPHSLLPKFTPMPLARLREPFDHGDWIFELKFDGFRALAYIDNGTTRLVSRDGNIFGTFPRLTAAIAAALPVENAILDGENVYLRPDGTPGFFDLMRPPSAAAAALPPRLLSWRYPKLGISESICVLYCKSVNRQRTSDRMEDSAPH